MEGLPHTPISYKIHTDMNEHSDSMKTCSQNLCKPIFVRTLCCWPGGHAQRQIFLIPIAIVLSGLAIL